MTSKTPDITVITPVFNGERYIRLTIESVLKYKESVSIEYIVINDGSTDSTKEILDEYSNIVRVVNKNNTGEADTVNLGIQMASAPFCLVVNADDPLISGELFTESLKVLIEDSQIVATYVDWIQIDENDQSINFRETEEYSIKELVGFSKCLPGPGAIFRTSTAREISGRSTNYKYVSDYDFWLRISVHGALRRIPKVLAQWRYHEDSTTVRSGGDKMAEERVSVIENFLLANPQSIELERTAKSHAFYYAARLALDFKISNPRRLLLKSFIARKSWPEKAHPLVVLGIILYPFPRFLLKIKRSWNAVNQVWSSRKNASN